MSRIHALVSAWQQLGVFLNIENVCVAHIAIWKEHRSKGTHFQKYYSNSVSTSKLGRQKH